MRLYPSSTVTDAKQESSRCPGSSFAPPPALHTGSKLNEDLLNQSCRRQLADLCSCSGGSWTPSMKHFFTKPRAAFAVLFFTTVLRYSCPAVEDVSNVSTSSMLTTEYEAPCLSVNFCTQAAVCCPTGMDDYGWIAAAVGWSLWFLTLILLCVEKVMKLRPDEPKYLVT
ncbi:PREDICTED: transmembrane protein 213 [Chlamydotis macqueenii]|uniref:transmembrane protein 213 n=1 Tax=Chlamydotis macqueenii TaxID=187382 RepID=UPI0005295F07|nr:PREDICTED: transmembrane protein 213 [Chlamydotis macqueenii]